MGKRSTALTRAFGLLLVSVLWTLFLVVNGNPEAVLFTIPVFMLAGPLAFGRYPGEDALASLRARRPGPGPAPSLSGLRPRTESPLTLLRAGRAPVRGPPRPGF